MASVNVFAFFLFFCLFLLAAAERQCHELTSGEKQYLNYFCYGFQNETNLYLEWQYNNASESSLSILQCGYINSTGWTFFGIMKSSSHLLKDIDLNQVYGCSFNIYSEKEIGINNISVDSHEIELIFYPENFENLQAANNSNITDSPTDLNTLFTDYNVTDAYPSESTQNELSNSTVDSNTIPFDFNKTENLNQYQDAYSSESVTNVTTFTSDESPIQYQDTYPSEQTPNQPWNSTDGSTTSSVMLNDTVNPNEYQDAYAFDSTQSDMSEFEGYTMLAESEITEETLHVQQERLLVSKLSDSSLLLTWNFTLPIPDVQYLIQVFTKSETADRIVVLPSGVNQWIFEHFEPNEEYIFSLVICPYNATEDFVGHLCEHKLHYAYVYQRKF